jgi:hypothetical protein
LDDLAEGDIDVQKPQATEGTAEIQVVPQVLHLYLIRGKVAGKVVEAPGIHPGENHQESTDFEGKDGEKEHPKAAPQSSWGTRGLGGDGRWRGKRFRLGRGFGRQGHTNSSPWGEMAAGYPVHTE